MSSVEHNGGSVSLSRFDIEATERHCKMQREEIKQEITRIDEQLYECGLAPPAQVSLDRETPLYLAIDEGLVRDWDYHHKDKRSSTPFNVAYCAVFFDGRKLVSKNPEAKRRYRLTNRYGHVTVTAPHHRAPN